MECNNKLSKSDKPIVAICYDSERSFRRITCRRRAIFRRDMFVRYAKRLICVLIAVAVVAMTACSSNAPAPAQAGAITEDNLDEICNVLDDAGLSNVDVFKTWVSNYLQGAAEDTESSGFNDADCRLTVMLLAGDYIESDSVEEPYDGTYLMFDVEAIDNQEAFTVLKDKRALFTTLFGEMPIPDGGFQDAFTANLSKYGIKFNGDKFSVISLVFKAYEEEQAFVGHTGLLIDCRGSDAAEKDYLFVEKISYNDDYLATPVADESELLQILSERPDYNVEEGEVRPLVYRNDKLIGEL